MAGNTAIRTFSYTRLEPADTNGAQDAKTLAVPLAPGAYAVGQVIGQISGTNVNDVQTVTSTLTGGSFRLYIPAVSGWTGPCAYNATGATFATNIQTAINTLLQASFPAASVVVTGTGPFTITAAGALTGRPLTLMTVDNTLATGGTATIAHTTTGVGPKGNYGAYASGNTDGTQTALGFLEYPVFVDITGAHFITTASVGASEFGHSELNAPYWFTGDFDIAQVTGLDATAVTSLGGRFIQGSLAAGAGVIHI